MSREPRVIRQLSPHVINKIAAGEVIERPASVLKELLENAVDSGATRIEARVEKGGIERIRVSDDGCGIARDQLMLALASHATSKIRDADDLFAISTLGFRGEALASIAEVGHLTLRSRVAAEATGYEVSVRGGQAGEIRPCSAAPGTSVELKHLFFNTPVRRKFMRTPQTELAHSTEAFVRIALAHPEIHFTLHHNERVIHDLPSVERWCDRISTVFGTELTESLMWVECRPDDSVGLHGYVANPTQSRSNNKMQYLFLNDRHIKDRSLQHALGEAYRGLLLTGRFPIAFLKFDLPADQIDVNVHPTKLEVRFQDGGQLYSQLLAMIREKFLASDLTAKVDETPLDGATPIAHADDRRPMNDRQMTRQHDQVTQWARGERGDTPRTDQSQLPFATVGAYRSPLTSSSNSLTASSDVTSISADFEAKSTVAIDVVASSSGPDRSESSNVALQAHNRYLVTTSEEGLVVIDQHALHERILYEQMRDTVLERAVEKQRLLTPEPVDLAPTEAAAVLENQELLADLGLEVEAFGGTTVLVQSYPAILGNSDPHELVRQIAVQLVEGHRTPEKRDLVDELLHMFSCKAAIKAGDPLTQTEIAALLEFRHLIQDSHHCPHGRPTTLVFTRQELDRRFKRI